MWLISDSTWNAKHTFIGYIAALTNNSKSHWLNRTKLYFSLTSDFGGQGALLITPFQGAKWVEAPSGYKGRECEAN